MTSDSNPKLSSAELDRLVELASAYREGHIGDAEVAELDVMLAESPAALDAFVELGMLVAELSHPQNVCFASSEHDSSRQNVARAAISWMPYVSVAALAVALLLMFSVIASLPRIPDTDQTNGIASDSPQFPADSSDLYVAQISDMTPNVQWGTSSKSHEFLLRVRRGDRFEIKEGLVELSYYSGARIILHGPCVFIPTGSSSGRLMSGQLTGQATDGDFALVTPSAEVIDLGTEFGVALDSAGNSEVSVFDGEVRVSDISSGRNSADTQLLKEGMSVRVATDHGITALAEPNSSRFVRSLPTSLVDDSELSLVDIASGLRGDRFRLAGVIAADSGEPDRKPWLREKGPGHSVGNGYQPTSWHPFVDGVLIPSGPTTNTQLDSDNHSVMLPSSTGTTWGPIWSRRRVAGAPAANSKEDYWGNGSLQGVIDRLEECQSGMIGLHANVGITFDLAAIGRQFGKTPTKFQGVVCSLNNASDAERQKFRLSADLRVYVDGELRNSRLNFTREDGEKFIEVELRPVDRFLTLVSSDAGEYEGARVDRPDGYDHVVLIDPTLSLVP